MRHRLKLYYDSFMYIYIYIVLSRIIHYIFSRETASTHLSRQDLDSETDKHTQYEVQFGQRNILEQIMSYLSGRNAYFTV